MNRKVIFDIGMNNGDDTAYYLHEGFQVVSIEANPRLVEDAMVRFQDDIRNGKLTILNVGIAKEEGILPFWVCETHPEWSSFDRAIASRDNCVHHEIHVPCRRFRSILEDFGVPFYLKVDIEGNDRYCLNDLEHGHIPQYISVEADGVAMLDSLAELGYTQFKCLSQFNFIPLEIPFSREQRIYELADQLLRNGSLFVRVIRKVVGQARLQKLKHRSRKRNGWTFPFGSSGPVGDALPGRWLKHKDASRAYQTFLKMMQDGLSSPFWTDKPYSFWVDFHATV